MTRPVDVLHCRLTGACTLTAAAPGPAGALAVDLLPGLQIRVDRVEPAMLVDVWVGEDLGGQQPAGATDVVRLLLGEQAALALTDPAVTVVENAAAAGPLLLRAVAAAATSADRPRLSGSVEVLRLASAAADAHPSPAVEGFATRAAAATAAALRTLDRHGADALQPSSSTVLGDVRELVTRYLGEVDLGALGTALTGAAQLDDVEPAATDLAPVLVGAPGRRSPVPTVVPVWAMDLPAGAVRAGGRDLVVEALPQDNQEAPFVVLAAFPGPVPPAVWLRVSATDGSPLAHVLGSDTAPDVRFEIPQQSLVPWGEVHLSIVADPAAPSLSAIAARARAAQAQAARALRDAGRARTWWLGSARNHADSGRLDLAAIALHQAGVPDLADALGRLAPGRPKDALSAALYAAKRWVSAKPDAGSWTARVADPDLAALQPDVDEWVRERLHLVTAQAEQRTSAADVLARMVEELSAFADPDADGVRLARAAARTAIVRQALKAGDTALAHVVFGRVLEDHEALDSAPALRAEVAHLRDRLVALLK